ncbi:5841_t:CDS:2, partial [Funneliformis caledonium]
DLSCSNFSGSPSDVHYNSTQIFRMFVGKKDASIITTPPRG